TPRVPVTDVAPLDELQLDELVERSIDARDPDRPAVVANPVEDLLGRTAARLVAEVLDHGPPGTAVAEPLRLQVVERGRAPALVGVGMSVGVHRANDIDSYY